MSFKKFSRRDFLKTNLGALIAAPVIIPASALGKNGTVAPSNRINLGFVGMGWRGVDNLKHFINKPGVQIVGVCDVDKNNLEKALNVVKDKYGENCFATGNVAEINRRADVDAVVNSTPDHWHIPSAVDAVRNGKDVYIEKPMSLTVADGRLLVEEAAKYGRVVQHGTQQRYMADFRRTCDLIRNGRIGKVNRVEITIPDCNKENPIGWKPQPVPAELDYDMWLGPAPWQPYHPVRVHYTFRYIDDYAAGQTTNWGTHFIDTAQWILEKDNVGPVEVYGTAEFPKEGLFDVAMQPDFTCVYEDGLILRVKTRRDGIYDGDATFYGEDGFIFRSRDKTFSEPAPVAFDKVAASEKRVEHINGDHADAFLDCVRTRKTPVANVEAGHRSTSICNLGNIAMKLGRTLQWDPKTEQFKNDAEANAMLSRPWRPKAILS